MFKKFSIIMMLFLICTSSLQLFAQNPQVNIMATPTLQSAQVLYFSNFDIFNVGQAQYLFDVIVKDIVPGVSTDDVGRVELYFYLDDPINPVAEAISDDFYLKQVSGAIQRATNIELIQLRQLQDFRDIDFSTNFDPPDTKFEDELYGSGKARSGDYSLRMELYINNSMVDYDELHIVVSNPSNIQLISPGYKVGSGTPEEVMTEFPIFTFASDGTEFLLSIYEKLSHHTSIEDVINSGNPIYQTSPSDPLMTPVLNYAQAGGQPLIIGSTYYWYVEVLVPTTGGNEKFRSEVYQFKVVEAGPPESGGQAFSSILEMLRPVVGNEADNLSKNLNDFSLKTIKINGRTITLYELQQILENYEGHLVEVSELVLY